MRPAGVALGLHCGLERLTTRGRQTAPQAGVQAGPPAREHPGDGGKSVGDVAPLLVVALRQQLHAVPKPGDHAVRGTQQAERLTAGVPRLLGLEPFPQVTGGAPVRLRRHRQPPELGQGRANEVGPGSVPLRAVVGGGTRVAADPDHARVDRIEHGEPVDVVSTKPQNRSHQETVSLPPSRRRARFTGVGGRPRSPSSSEGEVRGSRHRRRRRPGIAWSSTVVERSASANAGQSMSFGGSCDMSHHLDTPLAGQNGQLYLDDLFVFPGDRSTVLIMDVNSTITGPDVQRGFHPRARYEFKVHLEGADFEALTYRVSFGEGDADGRQAVRLHALTGDEARDDGATGALVLEGRTGEPASQGDARIWAGRIADPFYIDLSLLGIVNAAVKNGTPVDLSGWHPKDARNSFADTTVESIVLEVSHQHPQLRPGARTGVWCATKLPTGAGDWRQVNRAGNPMMWPIFWPDDTDFANPANARHPSADFNADGKWMGDLVTAVVSASGTSDDPQGYGQTVAWTLFPDVLPYVVGTRATYGFAAHNGRTQADNAPEAMLSLVVDAAVPSGLRPSVSERLRRSNFPYVVPA
jgi:hypothetical protein